MDALPFVHAPAVAPVLPAAVPPRALLTALLIGSAALTLLALVVTLAR